MLLIKNCKRFISPYRTKRPASDKIIFLSLEGQVTEEEYFRRISALYEHVASKIQFISVSGEAVNTPPRLRTTEQQRELSQVRPKQLVERINRFKEKKNDQFEFDKFPDDEFWIVCDVDENWSQNLICRNPPKTYFEEWKETVDMCHSKNYFYAISNPFFEIWLLLHRTDATEEDKRYAVTDDHPYAPTDHFRKRLNKIGTPLKNKKHIRTEYNLEDVRAAIKRARDLHKNESDLEPRYLATTVYQLIMKIDEIAEVG